MKGIETPEYVTTALDCTLRPAGPLANANPGNCNEARACMDAICLLTHMAAGTWMLQAQPKAYAMQVVDTRCDTITAGSPS